MPNGKIDRPMQWGNLTIGNVTKHVKYGIISGYYTFEDTAVTNMPANTPVNFTLVEIRQPFNTTAAGYVQLGHLTSRATAEPKATFTADLVDEKTKKGREIP